MKKINVFYFISPKDQSLQYLKKDFDEKLKEEEIKKQGFSNIPLYEVIHIIFCEPIPKYELIDLFSN